MSSPTYLGLVEALQRTLLALHTPIMGLQEIGPDELDIRKQAMVHINLELLGGDEENERDEGKDQEGRAGDVDMQPIHSGECLVRRRGGLEEEE
jgi:hypothetical protein